MLIVTEKLKKTYGTHQAVNSVSLHISKGDIYGLIGKNGAGKTTLMRLLVGTARPTDGNIYFNGESIANVKPNTFGALIEHPGLFMNETAYENMRRYMTIFNVNGSDSTEIHRILKLVNLDATGKKIAKQFSLGMKQRLGIAIALIGSPEVLVLDEPVNGLDPIGMREMREVVLSLNKAGITFFISSHLLDELSKIATRYGIMDNGQLVEEVFADDLNKKCQTAHLLKISENDIGMCAFSDCDYVYDGMASYYLFNQTDDEIKLRLKLLSDKSISVVESKKVSLSLEEYFSMRVGKK